MITTDQAIALAQEIFDGDVWWRMNPEQTAAFANKVREQTLLEAADKFQSAMYPVQTNTTIVITLRRMAGE